MPLPAPEATALRSDAWETCRRIWRAHGDTALQLYLAWEHLRSIERPGPRVPLTDAAVDAGEADLRRWLVEARRL